MKLVDLSIKKPVGVTVGVIFVILFGVLSIFRIPIQLTPEVEKPRVTVSTEWLGASPQEIETEIVRRQERELKSLEGLVEMTSESQESQGTIVLEFKVGTNLDTAALKVSNRLEQVRDIPQNAENPVISTVDTRGNAMAWFIMKPLEGNKTNINHLRDFAEEYIKPRFERVRGVGQSNVFGGQDREIHVLFDPLALASKQITVRQLGQAISSENDNISAGSLDEGKRKYLVRTIGKYRKPEDVENVIITYKEGAPVYVRDVAEVKLSYRDLTNVVRQNGEAAIAVNVIRETGSNSLEVMAGLRKAAKELNMGLLKDHQLEIYNVYDETTYIVSALDLVRQNLLVGGILAIIALLLFLRSATSTLIIGLAIPISIVGTFVFMAAMGRTINIISLAGMSFAVGVVVDNSVVVLENIYRHKQMGKSRARAAYEGTVEVWGAVLASTLTTTAVFLPVIFMEEEIGQLFRDIALAISVSVVLSLIVAMTVIPSASSKILRAAARAEDLEEEKEKEKPSFANLWGLLNLFSGFGRGLSTFVGFIASRPILRIVTIVFLTGGALFWSWKLIPKAEYLPSGNRNLVFGILLPPPGYNMDEFQSIARDIESDLAPYWKAKPGSPEAEKLEGPPIVHFFYVARGRSVFMGTRSHDPQKVRQVIPVFQKILRKIPGMIAIVNQSSLFSRGIGEGRAIDIQITGPELDRLLGLGRQVFFKSKEILPDAQIRPIPSLDLGNPEIQILTDRVRAAERGVTNRDLGFTVNALVDGVKVSNYELQGEEIDLLLRGKDQYTLHLQDIGKLYVHTPSGESVTVDSLGDIKVTTGPEQINHFERQRTIAIQVIPPEEMPLQQAMETIEEKIINPMKSGGKLKGLYNISLTGTADKLTTTRKALQGNFLLAALIAYLLMAALFENFLYPLVIMFTVPFASLGGFVGLYLLNTFIAYQALDVLTMLGFIILIGIVVNNAILIVHQSLNHIRDEGMDLEGAVREAVQNRLRPIFITTVTSVAGMLPLVLFPGSGSELYRGLGSVVVGGLVISTVFTIFLIPALFSLTYATRARVGSVFSSLWGSDEKEDGSGKETPSKGKSVDESPEKGGGEKGEEVASRESESEAPEEGEKREGEESD